MPKKINWTNEDGEFIKANVNSLKDEEMAKKLSEKKGVSISVQSLRKERKKLGIKKQPGRGKCAVVEDEPVLVAKKEDLAVKIEGNDLVVSNESA